MPDGPAVWGGPVRGRTCGGCTFCCTAVPAQLDSGLKKAGERCVHQRHPGCKIHSRKPVACQAWSCRWLFDDATEHMRRPDHAGFCIDPQTDTVLANGVPLPVLQVWVDPKRPEAHRDPALRDHCERVYRRWSIAALVRWGTGDGMLLVPPGRPGDPWTEHGGTVVPQAELDRQVRFNRRRP